MNSWVTNRNNTLNWSRFVVDIMSIHWKENINKFPSRFNKFFRFCFDRQKFGVSLTCFVRRNLNRRKMEVILMYFLQRNFDGRKFRWIENQHNFDVLILMCVWKICLICFDMFDMFDQFWYVCWINFRFVKNENISEHWH